MSDTEVKPMRIWVLHCPFKKNGFPSLGSFGKEIKPVVIVPMENWKKLCDENPGLQTRQFEVGGVHDDE